MTAGTLCYGALEKRWQRRKLLIQVGSWGTVAGLAVLALWPGYSLLVTGAGLAMISFFGATYVLLMAQGKRYLPDHLVGRGLAGLNFVSFAGTGIIQAVTGAVAQSSLDAGAAIAVSYGALFGLMAALLAVTTAIHGLSRDD
jgi:hypothetical protein